MKTSYRRNVVGGSIWSRWSLAAVLAAALTIGFSPAALADDTDASVTRFAVGSQAFPQMAQVYTALHTGWLYQVAVDAGTSSSFTPAKIEVFSVANGVPNASKAVVFQQTQTSMLGQNVAWHSYPLSPPLSVTAGTTYAIVTTAGPTGTLSNYLRWGYTNLSNANFSGGKMLERFSNSATWTQFGTSSWGFDFQTWVSAGQPSPTISVQSTGGASADEATPATMTGAYTNPAGGAVTLAATTGKATDLGAGRWSWQGDLYDEDAAPASVTVKLTDSLGQTASVTFPLTITKVKPVASITTGSLKALATNAVGLSYPEGTPVTLNGSATNGNPADQAGVWTYEWTVTRNGAAYWSGTGASYTFPNTDEATYVVTMTATDDGGMKSDPVSMTVTWSEITPTAIITSVSSADPFVTFMAPEMTLNFTGTYHDDPSPEAHTFLWNFGDGSSSTAQNPTHAYAVAKTYTVTLTVKDDEGVGTTATTTVKVLSTQDALAAMVTYVQKHLTSLNDGQRNSLIVKLNAASDAAARGNNTAAHNQLNAFLNELEADLKTNKISSGDYNTLRADAHAIMGAIGTYNRFVEWWPLPA